MDPRALDRLGHHVVSRRVSLGYRNRTDLADSLPFTVRTLADIEQGVRKASPGTYAILENKLAWAPGTIDTILTAGIPKKRGRTGPPRPNLSHTHRRALPRLHRGVALEMRRRIITPRNGRHDTWDDWDGPHQQSDWPRGGPAASAGASLIASDAEQPNG